MGLSNHPPSGGEERPPEQNIREPARSHRVTQSAQPCPELPEQLLCCASVRKTFPSQRCNVFPTSPKSQSTAASPLPAPTGTERCCAEKSSRRGRGAGTQSKGSPVHPVHPEHSLWLGNSLFLERAVAVSPEPSCVLLLRGQSCELHMEHLVCTARPPRESRRAEPTKHNLSNIKAQRRIPLVQKRFPGQLNANHLTASQEIDV